MSYGVNQPSIDSRAFAPELESYVSFASQADAMLASLQLFHNVPCRIMDIVFSVVTHPDFDSKRVTLRKSVDIIDTVKESRLKDRMAVVNKRSHGDDGNTEQTGFPRLILDKVFDIIHEERMENIRAQFEETLDYRSMYYFSMHVKEDDILKAMSLVHRSWTTPAQEALGRILYIGKPTDKMYILLPPGRRSIIGPWTSVVAIQLFAPIRVECNEFHLDHEFEEEYRQWFENLHRILVGFTNLKGIFIKSYASFFTEWSSFTFAEMVRRNEHLEEVTLYSNPLRRSPFFDLSPLIEDPRRSEHLRTLNVRGARFSDKFVENLMGDLTENLKTIQGPCFTRLNNVSIRLLYYGTHDVALLYILSTQSNLRLKSLSIGYAYESTLSLKYAMGEFTDAQRATLFGQLCSLRIDLRLDPYGWLKWIGPFCSGLKAFTLSTEATHTPGILYLIPTTIQSLDLQLLSTQRTTSKDITRWMTYLQESSSSRYFSTLKSFTFSLSRELIQRLEGEKSSQPEARSLRTQMRDFEEEMKSICKGAGVECYLDL